MCMELQIKGSCVQGEACKFSHSLIDMGNVQRTVGSPGGYGGEETLFLIQFVGHQEGSPGPWKISLKGIPAMGPGGNLYKLPVASMKAGTDLSLILRALPSLREEAEMTRIAGLAARAASTRTSLDHTQGPPVKVHKAPGTQQPLTAYTDVAASNAVRPAIEQQRRPAPRGPQLSNVPAYSQHHRDAVAAAPRITQSSVRMATPQAQNRFSTPTPASPVQSSAPAVVSSTQVTTQVAPTQTTPLAPPDHVAPAATASNRVGAHSAYPATPSQPTHQPTRPTYSTTQTTNQAAPMHATPRSPFSPARPSAATISTSAGACSTHPVTPAQPAGQPTRSAYGTITYPHDSQAYHPTSPPTYRRDPIDTRHQSVETDYNRRGAQYRLPEGDDGTPSIWCRVLVLCVVGCLCFV
ncbi:hypothetical protein OE88DRAFT_1062795 [Heliocybe sulcata]|uniref:C3H1-type domain-containing protein n=1 Tax=Heliocybe sulcata TaxID=5364 RepID=A0A5C3MM67_9AGAM|nr:hypothetical protein OE88DRAFT_1062795 [Heliocybe sulcata]